MNLNRELKPGDLLNILPDGVDLDSKDFSLQAVYTGPSQFQGWVEVYRPDKQLVVAIPNYRLEIWNNWTLEGQ
jgi:hypothetical protein